MKFDYVIGNPPYQKLKKDGVGLRIWDKFVYKGLDLLKKDGKLSMITPNSFMINSFRNNIWNGVFKKYQTLYINDNDITKKYFPTVDKDICFWTIKNTPYYKPTVIEDTTGTKEMDFRMVKFILSNSTPIENQILEKIGNNSNKFRFVRVDNIQNLKDSGNIFYIHKTRYFSYEKNPLRLNTKESIKSNAIIRLRKDNNLSDIEISTIFKNCQSCKLYKWLIMKLSNGEQTNTWIFDSLPLFTYDCNPYNELGLTSDEINYVENNA